MNLKCPILAPLTSLSDDCLNFEHDAHNWETSSGQTQEKSRGVT